MKIFCGAIATETNTFAPAPTGLAAFGGEAMFDPARTEAVGTLDDPYTACLAELAAAEGHEIITGLNVFAQPSGATVRSAYERMRDHLLDQLRAAMPVDAVLLPLHGAMVADGYPDCEGDLITRVRAIVGPTVAIGVELDLHCHFTDLMREQADVIIAYKEYPHTDIIDRFRELWRLTLDTTLGKIRPITAVHDLRMVSFWHTTREPMMGFVQQMKDMEGRDGVLSVSFGHGFPYGDVADSGARIWVVSDANVDPGAVRAGALAQALGQQVWEMRDQTRPVVMSIDAAIDRMLELSAEKPVIMADGADNSGGGAASDSSFILARMIERGIGNVAIGPFWDLGAIAVCQEAGEGARIALRVGGKCGPASGDPVDLTVTVRAIHEDHVQTALGFVMKCGPSVLVSTDDGVELVLISYRQQAYATDLFTNLGVDLTAKRAIVVKSSQHFHAQFAPLGSEVLYVDSPGLIRNDFENLDYRHRSLNYWPRVADPWAA